jgi:RNA polymerase sigma factor (sigma-70 family)
MADQRDIVTALAEAFRTGEASPALADTLRGLAAKVLTALKHRFQEADAEDAVAEALLLLATRPTAFRGEEGSLEGFLYVVARNVAARRARQSARQVPTDPHQLERRQDSRAQGQEDDTPPARPAKADRRRALEKRLEALAEEKQEILREFAAATEGEPWATRYARRTGDNANRVRVCLHRLLARLRKDLARELTPPPSAGPNEKKNLS